MPQPPRRVLIVRTSAMGDIVHALPVLRALRESWPAVRIGWVVEESFAPLLADDPDVDELLVVSLRRWRRDLFAAARSVGRFLARLRAFEADLAIDLMGNHKGALIAASSGAETVLGAARRWRREPSSGAWLDRGVATPSAHAVDRGLDLLTGLGLEPGPASFDGERVLPGSRAAAGTAEVLLHPAAGWANKEYPPDRWRSVLDRLAAAGHSVAVLQPPGEMQLARTAAGDHPVLPAAGLGPLAAHLRGCRLVLGGDSGPLHLAVALGTPVLCVLGPTSAERTGPYRPADGPRSATVAVELPCSGCYRRFGEAKACLHAISPDRVVENALSLLGSSSERRSRR